MKIKSVSMLITLCLSILLLSACNLPSQQNKLSTPTPAPFATVSTPTPAPSLCDHPYLPHRLHDAWEYSGSDTATGSYTRTDTIISSDTMSYTVQSAISGVNYSVTYACSSQGLSVTDPIQQYAGALLNNPNIPVSVKLTSVSGITLPARINPGDKWQQTADWEGSSQDIELNGRFVFDYAAAGLESVTTPAGTFIALRIDVVISVQVSALKIQAGTYDVSTWMAPDVGVVKTSGTSHVPGVDFTDGMQLTKFTQAP